ncbi:MAG: hypothetical protein U5R06_13550 [candidate division KSB1 bacterium]|nr:hypothetical protein [candidate division KSB1 bacterium]
MKWDHTPYQDPAHEITLEETDVNSGIFNSESQLLVAPALDDVIETQTDDGYGHQSRFSAGPVYDESQNDRTHQCYPGGVVMVSYQSASGETICDTAEVKCSGILNMRCYVLQEAYWDDGYYDKDGNLIGEGNDEFDWEGKEQGELFRPGVPSEPFLDSSSGAVFRFRSGDENWVKTHSDGRGPASKDSDVNASIKRAKIAWAQAGIIVNVERDGILKGNQLDDPEINRALSDGATHVSWTKNIYKDLQSIRYYLKKGRESVTSG